MQGFLISHGESWDELNDIWQYKVISLLIKMILRPVKTDLLSVPYTFDCP